MEQTSDKNLTPKERYDATMAQIEDERLKANGSSKEEQDELDEEAEKILKEEEMETQTVEKAEIKDPKIQEKVLDKTVGSEKKTITATKEQYQAQKTREAFAKSLLKAKAAESAHLKEEEKKTLELIGAKLSADKITDPVLKHLAAERAKLSTIFHQSQMAIQALQKRLLDEITKATDNIVKCKGAIENQDRQLLNFIKDNPDLLN